MVILRLVSVLPGLMYEIKVSDSIFNKVYSNFSLTIALSMAAPLQAA